ncbi:MAG: hypothetical protein J6S53_02715 [Lentisphaeria bacterium]|nr:hypothetical protein [Lentisphaeria bacterium]
MFCGEDTFLKKGSLPRPPHLPKTFDGIAFIVNDKNNSNFFYKRSKSSSIKHNV